MGTDNEGHSPKKETASQQSTGLKLRTKSLPWTPNDKAILAEALGRVCAIQRTYGKSAAELQTLVEGFSWVLKDYLVADVLDGLGQYLKRGTNIPTPSEIVAIIDPIPAPWKPDRAYYISLKEIYKLHGPYGLDTDEIEYIRRYEEHMRDELKANG